MATFKHDNASFDLPDKITVRQQLRYRTAITAQPNGEVSLYEGLYWVAVDLMDNWKSKKLPDPAALDFDTETDPAVTELVAFVANSLASHMESGEGVKKN